jgi:surface carbohydrate biosynthesis protein (TIGR04326 family)
MMQNLVWIELLDKIFEEIPQQNLGFYLQENQGWEIAFIHAWKIHNHGKLIGVAHSTVRYWDIRYFDYTSKKQCKIVKPQPDYTAINGLHALGCYKEANQKTDHLIKVEALRYLYLNKEIFRDKQDNNIHRKKKILVLGDIQRDLTISMVSALGLADISSQEFEFIFKSHPANIIEDIYLEGFKPKKTDQHLERLFEIVDIVITSQATSSGLEAYIYNIPVITFLNHSELNLSALRGMENAIFANSPDSLSHAIKGSQWSKNNSDTDKIFWLDKNLEGWKKLLSHYGY